MSTKQDGDWGEALVEKYLSERGCRIVEREWRCRFGEIDLKSCALRRYCI